MELWRFSCTWVNFLSKIGHKSRSVIPPGYFIIEHTLGTKGRFKILLTCTFSRTNIPSHLYEEVSFQKHLSKMSSSKYRPLFGLNGLLFLYFPCWFINQYTIVMNPILNYMQSVVLLRTINWTNKAVIATNVVSEIKSPSIHQQIAVEGHNCYGLRFSFALNL